MSGRGFTPNQCGSATPSIRLAGHLTQNQAQQDVRNVPQQQSSVPSTPNSEPTVENVRENIRSFRADRLLHETHHAASPFVSSSLPRSNVIVPRISPGRSWFLTQPPPPLPARSFSSMSLPSQSFPYAHVPSTQFYRGQNVSRPIYPLRPVSQPRVSRYSNPPVSGRYRPQSAIRPVQPTVEKPAGSSAWSDMRSRLFRDNGQGTSISGDFTGHRQREARTSSYVEQGLDLGSLHIGEGAESNTGRTEASGFNSTRNANNSKYVELLRRNQVQLNEEEGFEVNRDIQAGMEEERNSSPSVEVYSDDLPGHDFHQEGNFTLDLMRNFPELFSNIQTDEYNFMEVNPMLELEDPFEEGLRRLEVGDIPSAVLCFEATVQLQSDNALAWQYLGTTQAANEQDLSAIAALIQCLRLEPHNLTALMALAISYTNESYGNLAVLTLWNWLFYNPNYSDLVETPPPQGFPNFSLFLNPDTHQKVKDMFIEAANRNPSMNLDPDVQCALGVLFNLIGDCSKASDCFRVALLVDPEDPSMWNRLGATLANGQRSEEAVEAYYRSLSLNPGYVRARYNLAVSCINLGAQNEAMMHLLKALNLQANTNTSRGAVGCMSDSIWTTVKIVLSHLGRYDLLPAARNEDLDFLNRAFGYREETE